MSDGTDSQGVRSRELCPCAILALLLLFSFSTIHQKRFDAATPVSRLDLLHALVDKHSWSIDSYHTNTTDKAVSGGHYYSDKAPGAVALALPAFAATSIVLRAIGVEANSQASWLATSWMACVFSQALPAAVGGALLFSWLSQFVARRAALATVLALFLGSLPLPYSTSLFSHAGVIGLLSIAMWAMNLFGLQRSNTRTGNSKRMVLAGVCAGLALASEFSSGLVVMGFVGYVCVRRQGGVQPFVMGMLPPLLLIPIYSWLTIRTPFAIPYSYQATCLAMNEGLYAIKMPDFENLWRLLFSPTRGLVFWTPFLLLAIPGMLRLPSTCPGSQWLFYYIPLLHCLVISGRVWDWEAGPTLSARYFAPILPLLAILCALGVERWPRLGLVLGMYSIGIVTFATLTDACPGGYLYNPLLQLHLPLFLHGELSPNVGMILGLPPYASVALYYAIVVSGMWWLWRRLP